MDIFQFNKYKYLRQTIKEYNNPWTYDRDGDYLSQYPVKLSCGE